MESFFKSGWDKMTNINVSAHVKNSFDGSSFSSKNHGTIWKEQANGVAEWTAKGAVVGSLVGGVPGAVIGAGAGASVSAIATGAD